jgi:hypothetical protein
MKNVPAPNFGYYNAQGQVTFDAEGVPIIPRNNKFPVYIDGGIDKLSGQAKVIRPYQTDCYVCI